MNRLRTCVALFTAAASLTLPGCGGGSHDELSDDTGSESGERGEAEAAAPTWTAAAALSSGGAATPRVVIDSKGRALAIWPQLDSNSSSSSLWARQYVPGSGWGSAKRLEASAADVVKPQVAIDAASGRAMVVWNQLTSAAGYDVWARAYDPATGWGSAKRIESGDGAVGEARVAVDPKGNAMVVWDQQIRRYKRFGIWANRYVRGSGWDTATRIDTGEESGVEDGNARVAVSPSGDAIAVWERGTGSAQHLWSNRFVAGGDWGAAAALVTDAGSDQSLAAPEIAIDAKGKALLVWGQIDFLDGAYRSTVRAKRYATGWQAGSTAVAASTVTARGLISTPHLAVNAAGSAVVAWALEDGSIRASVAPAGGSWGAVKALKAAGPLDVTALPELGIDSSGKAFAAWAHEASNQIPDGWYRRYVPGVGWSAAGRFEASATRAATPALAVSANGSAVLLWQQWFDDVGTRIVGRHYGSVH